MTEAGDALNYSVLLCFFSRFRQDVNGSQGLLVKSLGDIEGDTAS